MKVKILSYNIHKGFTLGNRNFILEDIKNAVQETDADILFLQEVLGNHQHQKCKISDWETSVQFEYLADVVWPHYAYGKNAIYPEGHHGNAILSKFPIVSWENHNISTNRFEQRGFLQSEILIPDLNEKIILCNTHLDLTQSGRNKQIETIISKLKQEKLPWILVGDFNDWNDKISTKVESSLGAKDVFKSIHGKSPKTFPSIFPLLSLDRVFIHRIHAVSAVTLGHQHWRSLSDHLPLLVELELVQNEFLSFKK